MVMTPSDQAQISTNSEKANNAEVQQLFELRQDALRRGIAPSRIDEELLRQPEVPDGIKNLIQAGMETEAAREENDESGVQQLVAGTARDSSGVQSDSISPIAGEVSFGIQGQIQEIKDEMLRNQDGGKVLSEEQPFGGKETEVVSTGPQSIETVGEAVKTGVKTKEVAQPTKDVQQAQPSTLPEVTGYALSPNVINNSAEIAAKGDITNATTWQSMLVERLREMWERLQGFWGTNSKVPVTQ